MTTKTKPKPGFLAGIKAAISPPLDWSGKITAAEVVFDRAKELHARAAYEAQVQLPGSSEALLRASEALQKARDAVDTIRAAAGEYERQSAEQRRAANAAEIAKQDKASQAVFDRQAACAAKGEEIITAYLAWYAETMAVAAECQAEFAVNPRLRSDLSFYNVPDLIGREITRQAIAKFGDDKPLPPGANALSAQLSDSREWSSLSDQLGDLAKAVFA